MNELERYIDLEKELKDFLKDCKKEHLAIAHKELNSLFIDFIAKDKKVYDSVKDFFNKSRIERKTDK